MDTLGEQMLMILSMKNDLDIEISHRSAHEHALHVNIRKSKNTWFVFVWKMGQRRKDHLINWLADNFSN